MDLWVIQNEVTVVIKTLYVKKLLVNTYYFKKSRAKYKISLQEYSILLTWFLISSTVFFSDSTLVSLASSSSLLFISSKSIPNVIKPTIKVTNSKKYLAFPTHFRHPVYY